MSFFNGPLAPQSNPRIAPQYYSPSAFVIEGIVFQPLSGSISNITNASQAVVTSANHGLLSNTLIYIAQVTGMTEVNNVIYTVTVIDANTFSIDVDSTAFGAYTGSGLWTLYQDQNDVFVQVQTTSYGVSSNYVIGQEVRFTVPFPYGTRELNEMPGYVIGIPASNQLLINLRKDTLNFNKFIVLPAFGPTPPQIMAIGDVNSGPTNALPAQQTTLIAGSFINISPG